MSDAERPTTQDQSHTMQCMEVWGSNRAGSNGVIMPGLDAWVYSRPCSDDDAGGDVHYVSACATGRVIRALVADVSGHGVTVSEISADLRSLMRRFVNFIDQRKFLDSMNRQFQGLDETGHFATAVVATCWTPSNELTISLAGHPSPVRFNKSSGAWAQVVTESADIPLGLDKATSFHESRLKLATNDLVLLFTDGLTEARSPDGEELGAPGLLELLNTLDADSPETLLDELVSAIEQFQGGETPDDDITLMLLRPNALKPSPSLFSGLAAGTRVASAVAKSLLGRGPAPLPEMSARNLLGAVSNRFNRH